jgi:hypothetical protein
MNFSKILRISIKQKKTLFDCDMTNTCFFEKADIHIYKYTRKTPLLVPGVGSFSNSNIYALDQLIAETKSDLESTTCPLLSPILHYIIRCLNKKLFRFES